MLSIKVDAELPVFVSERNENEDGVAGNWVPHASDFNPNDDDGMPIFGLIILILVSLFIFTRYFAKLPLLSFLDWIHHEACSITKKSNHILFLLQIFIDKDFAPA